MITWVLDKFFAIGQMRRRLKVQMHEAMYMPQSDDPFYSPPVTGFTPSASGVVGADHYFLTMTNLSPKRDLVITHIWLETTPQYHVLDPQLPKRLAPDESWATGVPIAAVPPTKRPYLSGRVRLSTGKVVCSRHFWDVPPIGNLPRGTP